MGQGKSLTTWKVHKEISLETMILQSKYNKKKRPRIKKDKRNYMKEFEERKGWNDVITISKNKIIMRREK